MKILKFVGDGAIVDKIHETKSKESSKIGQEQKTLMSPFA